MQSIAPVVRSAIRSTATDYETAGHAIAYEAAAAYSAKKAQWKITEAILRKYL